MKKQSSRWGCLLGVLLILLLVVAGGGFWFLQSRPATFEGSPPSPVLIAIASPASGDEVDAGDYVSVTAQAVAPEPILSIELFVDGKPFGSAANSSQDAAWSWQAWPLGIHTLSARAVSADGQSGYSQTVILNVLAGDGIMDVTAEGGQSLVGISSNFGVPPDQVIDSNPNLDPNTPLPDGQPVKVPIGGSGSGNGSGQDQTPGGGGVFNPIFITWKFTPVEPVDKSYCYTSTGDGIWEKMPKPPFDFLNGFDPYTQFGVVFPGQKGIIQMQCWGWLGGLLKYLGQGEAQFDLQQPPNEVKITAEGFVLVGLPKIPPIKEDKFLAGGKQFVPPPYALREPQNASDCTAHGHPILAGFICNSLMNAKVKQYIILEWEWAPKFCWGGNCQWFEEIDGYRVFEIDPITKAKTFLKDIKPSAQKVTALPLPWGAKCYGVEAYVLDAGVAPSDMTTYCPGTPPKVQKVTLNPTHWLTTGGTWMDSGDCGSYGGADSYLLENQNNGFGNQSGQVLVGSYIVDDDGCYREGNYSAGIQFNLQFNLPVGAVVQNADLRYSKVFLDYGATGLAAPKPASCIKNIGRAKKDWSGFSVGNHFAGDLSLTSTAYNFTFTSVSAYTSQVSVTSAVSDWTKNPGNNHGFILVPAAAPHPLDDGSGECLSGLGNFQLDVYYFAP